MVSESKREDRPTMDPESWVDQYGDYLFGYALSGIGDATTAEDLVQETFLAGLRAQKGFEGRSSVRTWLVAILKNKIVDSLRKMSREKPVEDVETMADLEKEFFHEKGGWRLKPAEWEVNPSRLVERKEFWKIFTDCLGELPKNLSSALKLREMEGMGCEEICKVMSISASNCWVMLYRARMRMRRCLEINWFGEEEA